MYNNLEAGEGYLEVEHIINMSKEIYKFTHEVMSNCIPQSSYLLTLKAFLSL